MPTRRNPKPWNTITEILPLPATAQREIVQNLEAVLEASWGPLANSPRVDTEKVMQCYRDVIDATRIYLARKPHLVDRPRRSEQKSTLEALRHQADTIVELLRHVQDDNATYMALVRATSPQDPLFMQSLEDRSTRPTHYESMCTFLSNTEANLDLLSVLIQKACRTFPRDGGASKLAIAQHKAFVEYVRLLADIYTSTTGKRAAVDWSGGGKFVDFVKECLHPIDPERCTNTGLGKAIFRALHPKTKAKNGPTNRDRT